MKTFIERMEARHRFEEIVYHALKNNPGMCKSNVLMMAFVNHANRLIQRERKSSETQEEGE